MPGPTSGQGPQSLLARGMNVWIPCDSKVWRAAEVVDVLPTGTQVNVDGKMEVISSSTTVMLRNNDEFGDEGVMVLDDLTQLPHLHEPAILHALNLRYDLDRIYTNTGPILIAVNPFKVIPGLYDQDILHGYLDYVHSLGTYNVAPHVYGIAANAFIGIRTNHTSQMVLISGESGSGKTENTKFVLRLLTNMGTCEEFSSIESLVLESNPLLESFGNSCTLRNHNSSRFGKFIELKYTRSISEKYTLAGAAINTYLLEKVRVTEQAEGERNFHIFYQYCAAVENADADGRYAFPRFTSLSEFKQSNRGRIKWSKGPIPDQKEKTMLRLVPIGKIPQHHFTNQSKKNKLKSINDAKEFEHTVFAMMCVGIDIEEQTSIFQLIAAILLLGNTQLIEGRSEQSEVVETKDFVTSANILGISAKDLAVALTHKTIVTPLDRTPTPLKLEAAIENRDALARFIYGAIFRRLRDRINESFGHNMNGTYYAIGVLDIFGFECFAKNSFEQLCINFTNERLQQYFNNYVFMLEEALYKNEKIPWDAVDFPDNQDVISLIAGKMGIFSLLDEECRMPKGSDITFVHKLEREQIDSTRFSSAKLKPGWFIINHFAGQVAYCGENFLAKNKDQMSQDLTDCVFASSCNYTLTLVHDFSPKSRNSRASRDDIGRSKPTVSSEFKEQLEALLKKVDLSDPHFIRCVKPNFYCLPDEFDSVSVVEQLRYGGVLEVLKVQRAGYPVRLNHKECYDAYRVLCLLPRIKNLNSSELHEKVSSLLVMIDERYKLPRTKAGLSFTVGKTLAFFKHETYVVLERLLYDYRIKFATRIACAFRGWTARKRFVAMRLSAQLLQRCIRGMFARKMARKKREVRDADLARALREEQARQRAEEESKERKMLEEKQRQMKIERLRIEAEDKRREEEQRRLEEEEALRLQKQNEERQQELLRLRQEKLDLVTKLHDFESKVVEQSNIHQKKLEEERMEQQREMQHKMEETAQMFEEERERQDREREEEVRLLMEEVKEQEGRREDERVEHERQHQSEMDAREKKAKEELKFLLTKQKQETEKFMEDRLETQLEFERAIEEKSRLAEEMQSESQRLEEQVRLLQEQRDAYRERLKIKEHDFLMQLNQQEMHYQQENELRKDAQDARLHDLEKQCADMTVAHKEQMEQQKDNYMHHLELQSKTMDEQKDFYDIQCAENMQQHEQQLARSAAMFEQELFHKQQMFQQLQQENEDQRATFDEKLQEHLNRIQKLTDFTAEMSSLERQIEFLKDQFSHADRHRRSLQAQFAQKDLEYTHLQLMNSRMNVNAVTQFTLGAAAALKWTRKAIDITLVGSSKCGKSYLCSLLLAPGVYEPSDDAPIQFLELPAHFFAGDGQKRKINLLDCSGNLKHMAPILEQFSKTHWVFCIYDACDLDSIEMAFSLAERAKLEANVLLFGNMYRCNQGEALAVETETIRERAREAFILTLEGVDLFASAKMVFQLLKDEHGEVDPEQTIEAQPKKNIVKSLLLKPSVVASESRSGIFKAHAINIWVAERNAVTTIVIGREQMDPQYFVMAVGYREGHMAIFKVFRTEMELDILGDSSIHMDRSMLDRRPEELLNWQAHDRAITSMMFTPFEDQIVTSSTDLSIRFWNVDNGHLLQVFEDSIAITCVVVLPAHPHVFISGNANGILRVGDTERGAVLLKLKAPVEVRALAVDDTGLFIFCGTKRGLLLGLECKTPSNLHFIKSLRLQLSQKGIGKITFVPRTNNRKPMLLVNSSDCNVSVVEMHYNNAGTCTNLQVLRRFKNTNNLLPVSSCFAENPSDDPQDKGFVISASEDRKIYIWNLNGKGDQTLEHPSATIGVAINNMGTVLVSGDAIGNIFLWRRA